MASLAFSAFSSPLTNPCPYSQFQKFRSIACELKIIERRIFPFSDIQLPRAKARTRISCQDDSKFSSESQNLVENDSSSQSSLNSSAKNARLMAALLQLDSSVESLAEALTDVSTAIKSVIHIMQDDSNDTEYTVQEDIIELDSPSPYEGFMHDSRQKLAFKLQREFIQARVEGLGKPIELALEAMVKSCFEAKNEGVELSELQLLLISADNSLPPQYSAEHFLQDEVRIRNTWTRLIYTTFHLADFVKMGIPLDSAQAQSELDLPNPMDSFVIQTVNDAIVNGNDLERVLKLQKKQGPANSPAVKMMRQSQHLILFGLKLALSS